MFTMSAKPSVGLKVSLNVHTVDIVQCTLEACSLSYAQDTEGWIYLFTVMMRGVALDLITSAEDAVNVCLFSYKFQTS